jgi:hypothetical protein
LPPSFRPPNETRASLGRPQPTGELSQGRCCLLSMRRRPPRMV